MHGIKEMRTAYCHTCDEKTDWEIVHRFVDYHGVCHCLRCANCGREVPDFAWWRYQEEGKVVIPV